METDDDKAMVVFDDRFVALWFMPINSTADWLGALVRMPDGKFRLRYRIRYYNRDSTDPHDGKDHRSAYEAFINCPEQQVLEKMRLFTRVLTQHAEGPVYEIVRGNRTPADVMRELMRQPWAHAQEFRQH